MLKSELEKIIDRQNNRIEGLVTQHDVDRDMIKNAAEDAKKHTKLKRHVDKALCAIEAIKVTSCRDEIDQSLRFHIYQDAIKNDKPEPDLQPISALYVSLGHIEEILNRPVEEVKKDTRYGF